MEQILLVCFDRLIAPDYENGGSRYWSAGDLIVGEFVKDPTLSPWRELEVAVAGGHNVIMAWTTTGYISLADCHSHRLQESLTHPWPRCNLVTLA